MENFCFCRGSHQCQFAAIVSINAHPILLVHVVLRRGIKVDNSLDTLELRSLSISSLQDYQDFELPDVEEMNEGLNLVLWVFWVENKGLNLKFAQEHLQTVSLNNIVRVYYGFPIKDIELQQSKQDDEFIEIGLTQDIEMLNSFDYNTIILV